MPGGSTLSKKSARNGRTTSPDGGQVGSLVCQVAEGLRALLHDPRRLAEELIREKLGATGTLLGDGTAECPWIVFGRTGEFYGFYVRGRELVNAVRGGQDDVVCVL